MSASTPHDFTAGFLFAGLGAGALGFVRAVAGLGESRARFTNLGGVDFDGDACADFERITRGQALRADLHELQPSELRRFWGDRRPDAVFSSPPCKGMSRLLGTEAAKLDKYQKLNSLVFKGIFAACEAYPGDPPPLFVIENVPGIATRGSGFLDQVRGLLRAYGYAIHESNHDCGEIGGLAQHRRRFLLVARQPKAVSAFVYQPPKQRVRGCGEVLGDLPMPEHPDAGPLHRLPRISWLNWVRLSLIPAGGDHRDLPDLPGLRMMIDAEAFKGSPGLAGVLDWAGPAHAVTGKQSVSGSNTPSAVADPRIQKGNPNAHRNKFAVADWEASAGTVTGASRPGSGAPSVADPRILAELTTPLKPGQPRREVFSRWPVYRWAQPCDAVTGPSGNGDPNIADPRLTCVPRAGAYGVVGWAEAAATVTGSLRIDNGRAAVADPRRPPPTPVVIQAADGTWHRPMTDLDLATLQGLPATVGGAPLELARGGGVSTVRERIGNAVPVGAAEAIARSLLKALLASKLGTWSLSADEIWVRRDGRHEEMEAAP